METLPTQPSAVFELTADERNKLKQLVETQGLKGAARVLHMPSRTLAAVLADCARPGSVLVARECLKALLVAA